MPTLFELFRGHADRDGDKLALISESDGARSWGELVTHAGAFAYHLASRGIGPGDRVCLWSANSPQWVEAYVGVGATGSAAVPLSPDWTDHELEYVLRHSRARVLACEAALAERAVALLRRVDGLEDVVVLDGAAADGAESFADLVAAAPPGSSGRLPTPPEGSGGGLLYTSGTTTGRPKAVPLHPSLLSGQISFSEMFGCGASDRSIFVTPLFHGNGLAGCLSALLYGGSAVFPRRFSAHRFWRLVDLHRPTYLFTLAPVVHILMALPPSPAEGAHGLRVIVALGSGPVTDAIEARYGVPVIDWYGMTEAGMGTYTRLDEPRRPGSSGRPFPGPSMKILRDDGTDAATGEVGEVAFRRDAIGFAGYVDDEEATAAAVRGDWFLTGDLGFLDEDGYFYFCDRKKDIVRRAGENISSLEVEGVLRSHPAVGDAAVVGQADPVLGERVVAFLVPAPGQPSPTLDDLAAHAATRLAAFKIPERVVTLDELPRTPTGKVEKFRLRELLDG